MQDYSASSFNIDNLKLFQSYKDVGFSEPFQLISDDSAFLDFASRPGAGSYRNSPGLRRFRRRQIYSFSAAESFRGGVAIAECSDAYVRVIRTLEFKGYLQA